MPGNFFLCPASLLYSEIVNNCIYFTFSSLLYFFLSSLLSFCLVLWGHNQSCSVEGKSLPQTYALTWFYFSASFPSLNCSCVPVVFLTAFQVFYFNIKLLISKIFSQSFQHLVLSLITVVEAIIMQVQLGLFFPVCVFCIYHGAIFFLSLYCSVIPLRALVTVYIQAFFILNNSLTLAYIVIYLDLFSSFLQDPTVNLHHYDI